MEICGCQRDCRDINGSCYSRAHVPTRVRQNVNRKAVFIKGLTTIESEAKSMPKPGMTGITLKQEVVDLLRKRVQEAN